MNEQDLHDLQRWLDDELDADARAAFEQRLAEDAELRAEADLHRQVGESLQRSFAVPDIPLPVPIEPVRPQWPLFLAGAASAAAVLLLWLQPWSERRNDVMREAVGRSWVAVCGQPDEFPLQGACASPDELTEYVQPLAPDLPASLVWQAREGVRFQRGLETKPEDGLRVLELLVLPATEIFVFVVPAAADPRPVVPRDAGWRLFRKACGPLVAYELTPLDEARGLDCLTERQ